MRNQLILASLCAFTCLYPLKTQAQKIPDSTKQEIGNYLTGIIRQQVAIPPVRIDSVAVVKKKLQLFTNEYLSHGRFDRVMTDSIYARLRTLLPAGFKRRTIELYSDGYKIEDYIPLSRKEHFTYKTDAPLRKNLSVPAAATKGLQNRHIALWQSHGWYYEQTLDRWEWQRARIFQTVEDLLPQSFVLPYLVPMLENAGASVILPRERDTQRHEIIVDNDGSTGLSDYTETGGGENWSEGATPGFAHRKTVYMDLENPFLDGAYRQIKTIAKGTESECTWLPDIPEKGKYGVYISYASLKNSTKDAHYTVYHTGGKTEFSINQTMGGGTWIFLGFFDFDKGKNDRCKIVLSNKSKTKGRILTADAVKIGGGMGNIARGQRPETSGRPRYTEGARYWLQWAGMPDSVYRWTKGERDYTDDYQSRGLWVNQMISRRVPVDAVLAFHTDAGTTYNDSIIGTLGICMTHYKNETFDNGQPRILSRDLVSTMMDEIVRDIRFRYEPNWTRRRIWNRNYSEARLPEAPTMLLELLSHQNFADMRYALDPNFRFSVSRSLYKGFLKFIAHQYRSEYVVQPLPVEAFSARFTDDTQVHLQWRPVADELEPTAVPTGYIVYTATGDDDFDNGVWVKDPQAVFPVEKDRLYHFRITAVNDGGESFPSETLSVFRNSNEKGTVLVVNGFDRVSAPGGFTSSDSLAGFTDWLDHGVPDRTEYNYIGSQYEFRRKIPWMDDDAVGFGASHSDYETSVLGGNTFDYPRRHGMSIVRAGYSFVSASAQSVMNGQVDMNAYPVVDLILGKQKQTSLGRGAFPPAYKTFPDELQATISAYCRQGGNLFVSGAYVASDLWDNPFVKPSDQQFAREILKYQWRTGHAAVTGEVKAVFSPFPSFEGDYQFHSRLNTDFYAVESPDALEPAGEGSYTVFRYSENNLSAGVAFSGDYKVCVLGFPFEAIRESGERDRLMQHILDFMGK
ncbi:MAG: xanthan lyase [Dysgonamonadaceae bacterium]|nr:xanthan lyase [Dysgonamonadaceae bacterium]